MKILLWLLLLALAGSLTATPMSTSYELALLSGTVVTTDDLPLEYATVSAYDTDSSLVEGTVTDAAGRFELNLPNGNYRLRLEFIGLGTKTIPVEVRGATDLGRLALSQEGLMLDAVEVRADKSRMNLQLDKKVFNVGEDALAQGGVATDVLQQVPSVAVSAEGAVSLRGNASVTILINGRPSALTDNGGLAGIPAASIERVEVITNPSAKYEAAGSAGILNIILKKSTEKGYGGTLTLGTGVPADHQAQIAVNLRRRKFNLFANLGGRYANFFGSGDFTRSSRIDGETVNLFRVPDMDRHDDAWSGYFGFDYRPDEATTLTASYAIYDVLNDDFTTNSFAYTDGNGDRIRDLRQTQDYVEPGTYHQADVVLARQFGEDRKFTLLFNHDAWTEFEREEIRIDELAPEALTVVRYRTATEESSQDYLLQSDYESPFGKHGSVELGLRAEARVISADYLAEASVNEQWEPLGGFRNDFDYFERIGSAYFQYAYKREKVSFQLGLRNEFTDIATENTDENQTNLAKQYNRFFPSASARYQLSETVSTQVSYSRRIRRPAFWQLNPFAGLRLPTSLFTGNPDIDPAFTDRLEINLLSGTDRLTFNPAVYVSRTTDWFENVVSQTPDNLFGLEDGTVLTTPVNLDEAINFGAELTASYRPGEVFRLDGDLHYFGTRERGEFAGRNFDYDFATWTGSLRPQVRLKKGLSLQARVGYSAPQEDAQTRQPGLWNGSIGGTKRWGDRLSVTVNVTAPRYFRETTFRPTFRQIDYFQWTGWRSRIGAQYRFERGAKAEERRQRGSIR